MNVTLRDDLQHILHLSRRPFAWLLLVMVPCIYVVSGFYSVGAEQRAIVFRFGKIIEDNVMPGMHYRMPWPVDRVQLLPAAELGSVSVDYSQDARRHYLQPEMTTLDGDLVDIAFDIQYNIPRPGIYQSTTKDAEAMIRQLAITEALYYSSENSFEDLLTTGRLGFQNHLRHQLQIRSDDLNLGMNIISVLIRRLDAPRSIKRAFDRVQIAPAEKRKMIEEAQSERVTRLVNARSKANDIRVESVAYASDMTEQAKGDFTRHQAKYQAYQQAPELTLYKEYFEQIQRLLPDVQVRVLPVH